MQDLIILERKDRENGSTHLWLSYGGERVRLVMQTATLNATDGHNILTLMARRAAESVRQARETGKLRMESSDVDGSI